MHHSISRRDSQMFVAKQKTQSFAELNVKSLHLNFILKKQ